MTGRAYSQCQQRWAREGEAVTDRFLTTTEASEWLLTHYGMSVPDYTIRRLAKSGTLKVHRKREKAWYTFTHRTLGRYAESEGFTRTS
jgi:hypothetical protein